LIKKLWDIFQKIASLINVEMDLATLVLEKYSNKVFFIFF